MRYEFVLNVPEMMDELILVRLTFEGVKDGKDYLCFEHALVGDQKTTGEMPENGFIGTST